MGNLSKVFHKQKRTKHMIKLGFITQFKTEFSPPFTGCKKMLGNTPERSFPFLHILHKTAVDCFSYFFQRYSEYNV